jgi:hypothetical protein
MSPTLFFDCGSQVCCIISVKGICLPALLTADLYQKEKKMSNPIIAINMSKVANRPESFATMHQHPATETRTIFHSHGMGKS